MAVYTHYLPRDGERKAPHLDPGRAKLVCRGHCSIVPGCASLVVVPDKERKDVTADDKADREDVESYQTSRDAALYLPFLLQQRPRVSDIKKGEKYDPTGLCTECMPLA